MALVLTNGHQGMRFSDDEDGEVQSGSATGFSDVELSGDPASNRRLTRLSDPVTQILDKIDAELVSLTRSQGSTATTATDSTVVNKLDRRSSMENSLAENGEGLSMSQLGSFKPSVMSLRSGTSDQDTGIGTGSIHDHSLQHQSLEPDTRDHSLQQRSQELDMRDHSLQQRSQEPDVRPLEPGDYFRGDSPRRSSPTRQVTTPNIFLNGQHMSDDDKQRQENQSATAPYEAKQVDDKFKEILQKRKGILKHPTRHKSSAPSCDPFDLKYKVGVRMSTEDDTQTIRTEDFVDKFQDTLVYSSADEAERIRNLDDDLHSDGGSDTDTLQRKLAILTRTPVPKSRTNKDGKTISRPLTRPMIERAKGRFASPYETRPKKVSGVGTPPVYPKPTVTTSLPRPSTRSTLKFAPGHASDADSVKTEDFENKFKEMAIGIGTAKKEESDLESVSNDPIHTKVKQLLKATSKYKTTKSDYKPKQHVRISPQPVQYDKGEESDDTLCSDKPRVASPRKWNYWESGHTGWNSYSDSYSGLRFQNTSFQRQFSKSSSFEDSSKSSCSLSLSSFSSGEKGRNQNANQNLNPVYSDNIGQILSENAFSVRDITTPISQVSGTSSLPSWNDSELPLTSTSGSRSTSIGDSVIDDGSFSVENTKRNGNTFSEYLYFDCAGPTRRRSLSGDNAVSPYSPKKTKDDNMSGTKEKYRQRDLIAQEEEEDYPFSKYTFNKKSEKSKRTEDSSSSMTSSMSNRSSSQESIFSVGLMKQFSALKGPKVHRPINKQSSSSSMMSSLASSFNDFNSSSLSMEESLPSQDFDVFNQDKKMKMTPQNSRPNLFLQIPLPGDRASGSVPNQFNYQMYNFPQVPVQNPEQMLNNMGFSEARSILPDRFLKSWIEKALLTQQEEYVRSMMSAPHPPSVNPPSYYNSPYFIDDNDLPPSVSAQHSGTSTPQYFPSMDNIHGMGPSFSDNTRKKYLRRNLHRSASLNQSSQSVHSSKCDYDDEDNEDDLARIGALPLKKENSFDKLKRILQTSAANQYRGKSYRRSMFASNHQNSLPICLETLSEEEEECRRQSPSTDKKSFKGMFHSKMRSFLEEEERLSGQFSSSEQNSDVSRRESLNNDSASCSCIIVESDDSNSLLNDGGNENNEFKTPANITIPSIIVEKDNLAVSDTGIEKGEMEKMLSQEAIHIDIGTKPMPNSANFTRPVSPNPDNQNTKNCSEVADIFERNERRLNPKSAKFGFCNKGIESELRDWSNSKPDQLLRLSVSDLDDKHLSPSSSIASPNIMSPVTVIEVDLHKVDNPNDSVEIEEQPQYHEIKESRRNSVNSTKSNNFFENFNQRRESCRMESVSEQGEKTEKVRRKSQVPKCLTLKRHFNGNTDVENKECSTDCNNVFLECNQEEEHSKRKEKYASIQTEDSSLAPLIHVSEITELLELLCRTFPAAVQQTPYYLAQDKGVQCDLKTDVETVKPIGNDDSYSLNDEGKNASESLVAPKESVELMVNASCQTLENDIGNNLNSFEIHSVLPNTTEDAVSHSQRDGVVKDSLTGETFKISICPRMHSESSPENSLDHVNTSDEPKKHPEIPPSLEMFLDESQIENGLHLSEISNNVEQNYALDSVNFDFIGEQVISNVHMTDLCHKLLPIDTEYSMMKNTSNEFEDKLDDCVNSDMFSVINTYKKSSETEEDNDSMSGSGTVLHDGNGSLDSSISFKKSMSAINFDNVSLTNFTEEDLEVEHIQSAHELKQSGEMLHNSETDEDEVSEEIKSSEKSEVKVVVGSKDNELIKENHNVSICYVAQRYRSDLNLNLVETIRENDFEATEPIQQDDELTYVDENCSSNVINCGYNEHVNTSTFHSECTLQLNFNPISLTDKTDTIHKAQLSNNFNEKCVSSADFEIKTEDTGNVNNNPETCDMKQQEEIEIVVNNLSDIDKARNELTSIKTNVKLDNLRLGLNDTSFRDSGIMLEDYSQPNKGNDILQKFQELIDTFEDTKENSCAESTENMRTENECNDYKTQVISTRSLDFETIGSRKGILQRCVQTGFAKSFDFWGLDMKTFDNNNDPIDVSKTENLSDTDDERFHDQSVKLEELHHDEHTEEGIFIDELYEHDSSFGSEKVSYQVGLKYNEKNECYDVYGRLKIEKDDDTVGNHNEIGPDCFVGEVNQLIIDDCNDEEVFEDVFEINAGHLNSNIPQIEIHKEMHSGRFGDSELSESGGNDAFNMFEQVDQIDTEMEGYPQVLSPHFDHSVSDNEMQETLDEIERLYTTSFSDDHLYLEECSLSETQAERNDFEHQFLESYRNKLSTSETHLCRNCGHFVAVPVSQKVEATIEHDYCCECSPLNLTADMLEKRRIDRMTKRDTRYK